jgi:hypothetical protein
MLTNDFIEWKYQLPNHCIFTDYSFYFEIQDILDYFDGFMISAQVDNLVAQSYHFKSYDELVNYVKNLGNEKRYLHCVLKNKKQPVFCLYYAK